MTCPRCGETVLVEDDGKFGVCNVCSKVWRLPMKAPVAKGGL